MTTDLNEIPEGPFDLADMTKKRLENMDNSVFMPFEWEIFSSRIMDQDVSDEVRDQVKIGFYTGVRCLLSMFFTMSGERGDPDANGEKTVGRLHKLSAELNKFADETGIF